jgi:glutamate synthase domain-containing protein 2
MFEKSYLRAFHYFVGTVIVCSIWAVFFLPPLLLLLFLFIPLIILGFFDAHHPRSAILRNFPVIGHLRFLMEELRPEMQQYFVEQDTEGRPYNRQERSVVYQRSKNISDTIAFGSLIDMYEVGYEWVNHSLSPVHVDPKSLTTKIGGPNCSKPYHSSIYYISGMSYGALSSAAVRALNSGTQKVGIIQNTGEGGLSPYHLEYGGDLIWQVGTGYFGCRNLEGQFDPAMYKDKATHPNVKMIELKLSQGAKPGHGGILPAEKVTPEIAKIRGVPMGKDILSPSSHSAFSTPIGLLEFLEQLRQLSGGKPVGIKLCIGKRREFLAICKAIIKTDIYPDFITVDGGEGGSGATPLEFASHIGCPCKEALIFVHNALIGFGIRDKIKISANGKTSTGFGIVNRIALGADFCGAARAFMLSIGCIQALKCNKNVCPVGITTHKPDLMRGLVVTSKAERVAEYHKNTMISVSEIIGSMGISHTEDLRHWHIIRRTGPTEIKHYGEIYHYLSPGDLLKEPFPPRYKRALEAARADSFSHILD